MELFILWTLINTALAAVIKERHDDRSIIVDSLPKHVRPYIIPYMSGTAYRVGNDIFRVLADTDSSGGAFMVFSEFDAQNGQVPTHWHQVWYETFYCFQGGMTLFAGDETRALQHHDFGVVTQNHNHTYVFTEPDTVLLSFNRPSGFDKWIYNVSTPWNPPFPAPYPPEPLHYPIEKALAASGPPLDIYLALDAPLNYDITNCTSDLSTPWHNGPSMLPDDSTTPFFVANNRGPKYLHRELGQVIAPLLTPTQTAGNSTLGTVLLRQALPTTPDVSQSFAESQLFVVLDGELRMKILGQKYSLLTGDTVFLPSNTEFAYWSEVAVTKVWIGATGGNGLLNKLMEEAEEWPYAVFPAHL